MQVGAGRSAHVESRGVPVAAPILALDMYEHSYHIDYGAKAGAYVEAFMRNIRWSDVAALHEACAAK